VKLAAAGLLGMLLVAAAPARAQEDLPAGSILAPREGFRIESVAMRTTYYDQMGYGFQSQAGPAQGPGSEQLTVWQPQLDVTARQGDRVTYRLLIPVDIVTAASPDAIDGKVDAVSSASRYNEAGSIELLTTYRADSGTQWTIHPGFHLEEQMRSWHLGFGTSRSLADDNAVISASVDQNVDWLDDFTIQGQRIGHVMRTTSNASVGLLQLLSPTTVANVNYGLTVQFGELGNTWNSVPLATGERESELLPHIRQRHALVGRLAQWLPWQGALHAFYRFYADDWGITAHSAEAELYQRFAPWLYVRANYRFHVQDPASFFAEHPSEVALLRTADSDLSGFHAQTLGGMVALEWTPAGRGRVRSVHVEAGYERYFRSNGLSVDIYTCALALGL